MAVMMSPRESWTDQRLDDLNRKVDEGFGRLGKDIREMRDQVNGLRAEMHERFESLNRTLIGAAVAIVVALIGGNAAVIAALIGVKAF
jgi:hypothetical protein